MNFFTFFGTTWNGMKYWGGSYSRSHPPPSNIHSRCADTPYGTGRSAPSVDKFTCLQRRAELAAVATPFCFSVARRRLYLTRIS